MRQAGIIAAPGIYAFEYMIDRLKEDNDRAKRLAERLGGIDGLYLEDVQTNSVSVDFPQDLAADEVIQYLKDKYIKVKKIGPYRIRMVLHYLITDDAVDYVVHAFRRFFEDRD